MLPVTDSRSFTIKKFVPPVPPDIKITRLDYPASAEPGEIVEITWYVENRGGDRGVPQWFRFVDLDTGAEVWRADFALAPGGIMGATIELIMPDKDWRLRAEAGHSGTVTDALDFLIGLPVPPAEWLPTILGAASPLIAIGAVVGAQELKRARIIP